MEKKKISVITLNYKKTELTLECVKCLKQYITDDEKNQYELEIIVVDNSAPETAETLKKELPADVTIIENEKNEGFAKANNQGLEIATGDYILFINNDIFIESDCLKNGIRLLDENKDFGIWSPKLIGLDRKDQVSVPKKPTILELVDLYITHKVKKFRGDKFVSLRWTESTAVDYIAGAFVLMRHDVAMEVGGFDEDYFFLVEDIQLSEDIRALGYKIIYDPTCRVVHVGSASHAKKGMIFDPHIHNARLTYFRKKGCWSRYLLAVFIVRFGLGKRILDYKINNAIKSVRNIFKSKE